MIAEILNSLCEYAERLDREGDQFGREAIQEAMAIVHTIYWDNYDNRIKVTSKEQLNDLIDQWLYDMPGVEIFNGPHGRTYEIDTHNNGRSFQDPQEVIKEVFRFRAEAYHKINLQKKKTSELEASRKALRIENTRLKLEIKELEKQLEAAEETIKTIKKEIKNNEKTK